LADFISEVLVPGVDLVEGKMVLLQVEQEVPIG